jgi:hypothetical protein
MELTQYETKSKPRQNRKKVYLLFFPKFISPKQRNGPPKYLQYTVLGKI